MSTQSLAQMLSTVLYHKRFFPYYVFNILGSLIFVLIIAYFVAGVDEDGKGGVYSYDPVGNFERENWRSAGSASHLIQPFLDNQVFLTFWGLRWRLTG